MPRRNSWTWPTVVLITVLAPLLGGTTQLWSQATICFAAGITIFLAPPRRSLGILPNILLSALFLVALTAFLPAEWFPSPQWRIYIVRLGAQLPSTRSPQPWLSLQWTGLLLLGLSWTYYLVAFRWTGRRRKQACQLFAIGILALAVTLIVAFVTKSRIPFWPDTPEFGFFPNRNQTSNVLGLGGVMVYALALQHFVEGGKYWSLWLIALAVICWALIVNASRAGIILFFFGSLALHLYFWKGMQERRRPLIAFGGIAVLVALFIVNGGATLARFGKETAQFPENLRWSLYRDAVGLVARSSLFGNGLGNFRSLFAFNRSDSLIASEAAHPESDWLWSAVDLGWPAVLVVVVLLIWWINRCRPFDPGSSRLLRVAALIYGCGFAVHGIFDVSAHRPGALWPALFFASIAVHPSARFQSSTVIPTIFRGIGVLLISIGTWWMGAFFGFKSLPVADDVERIKTDITATIDHQDYAAVPVLVDEGLRIAPLDWLLYYKRGVAEVAQSRLRELAMRDFGAANYLNPLWPDLCLHEGQVWLAAGETDLAIDAWNEALRRDRDRAPNFYADMLTSAKGDAVMLDRLRQLADDNNALLIIYLRTAGPFEFQIEAERLTSEDRQLRSFSASELNEFFSQWYKNGNKLELADILEQHPDWKKIGWRLLARIYADYQDYHHAWDLAEQFGAPPQLPKINSDESIETLGARFVLDRTNVENGLALYFAQVKHGQSDAAFGTLRQMTTTRNSPRYLSYLEAQRWAARGDWPKAWKAWARYEFGEQ